MGIAQFFWTNHQVPRQLVTPVKLAGSIGVLSEAFLQQTNVSAALAVLGSLTNQIADPALLWQREQLLGEVRLQAKDPVALQSATNLLNLSARLPNAVERRHEGLRFQARVHLALGQAAQGAAVLGRIANDQAFTPAQRKSGLLESVGIFINQQQFTNAAAQLEAFLQANPADPASGELRLALADVYLQNFTALRKQADPPVAPLTNLLSLAGAQLDLALTNLSSTNLAEARLKRGWTHWESHTIAPSDARLSNALENFEAAAQLAPKTLTGVVGLHKAADCRFLLGQLAGAITNYSQVVAALDTVPGVKSKLGTEAFYQLARAHLQLTNVAAAGEVSEQMLHLFPSDPLTSQARLLYVSALLSGGRSAEARTIVTNLLARVPSESALPEARLALARTYQEQGAWTNALQEYEDWLGRYTNHTLRPFVEFDWAWLTLQAGNATNAYHLFTNFVARYPRDPLAPRAQTLVANYHYNLEQWVPAEQNYQRIFQNTNWPPSAEKWQAHLMAARAAFFRQNYNDAVEYVTRLIDTKETPTNILGEAFFLLGDIILERPVATTNALQNFSEAIKAFSTIPQRFPKHPLTPLAWGKVGDCYYQYASQSPDDYARATNAYWNVLTNSAAPVVAICQANVGIGDVLEKMSALTTNRAVRLSLQRQALDFHLNVIYGKGLNGEPADPYWLGRAATGAARLAEAVGQPGQAVELYQRLIQLIPSRGLYYQTRIQALTKSG